jgi:RNA polymerase sigma-70 factor, ECF subfamily
MNEHDREKVLKELMMASLDGDQTSYQKFLRSVSEIVKGYLKKRCHYISEDRIEDLVQEVLLSVHLKRSSYRTDLAFLPWLFTITRHKLIDDVRAEKRKEKLSMAFEAVDNSGNAELIELDLLAFGITEKQKEILYLAKVEEFPLQDIADQLHMGLSSVKVNIHRALKTLRR